MVDYPELAGHLALDASIVVNSIFERAVIHISCGILLLEAEKESFSRMLLAPPMWMQAQGKINSVNEGNAQQFTSENIPHELSYAQKLELQMKRRKTSTDDIAVQYINLDILCGTSVSYDQLFSAAKHILTDTRKSISPVVFESVVLLKVIRKDWDVSSVGQAMGQTTVKSFGGVGLTSVAGVAGSEIANGNNNLFYDS
jgi:hypothetical protein